MDCAKAILLFYEFPYLNFENVLEYNSRGEIPAERKTALICVPSTSGTGSEVTRSTVITDPEQELQRIKDEKEEAMQADPYQAAFLANRNQPPVNNEGGGDGKTD